jgi:hypothetical protein
MSKSWQRPLANRLHGRNKDSSRWRIKGYHDYGTFTPIQVAAIAALEGPQEGADIALRYQKRRDVRSRPARGWLDGRQPEGVDVRVGEDSVAYREADRSNSPTTARQGEGLGVARHRLRRIR